MKSGMSFAMLADTRFLGRRRSTTLSAGFTVRESHVEMGTDFLASKPEIEARLVLTIRIGRIFGVLFATGFEFLRYMLKRKQQEAKAAKREKQVTPPVSDAAKPAQMSA